MSNSVYPELAPSDIAVIEGGYAAMGEEYVQRCRQFLETATSDNSVAFWQNVMEQLTLIKDMHHD